MGSNLRRLLLPVLVVAADQGTKHLAQAGLDYHVPLELGPFLNLTLTYNAGAAFSLLGNAGGWQRWLFIAIGSAVSAGVLGWLLRAPPSTPRWPTIALGLVLGGAVGNVWDRIQHGMVVDFIDLHWGGRHWPAFNLADSAITIGACVLIVLAFGKEAPRAAESEATRSGAVDKDGTECT